MAYFPTVAVSQLRGSAPPIFRRSARDALCPRIRCIRSPQSAPCHHSSRTGLGLFHSLISWPHRWTGAVRGLQDFECSRLHNSNYRTAPDAPKGVNPGGFFGRRQGSSAEWGARGGWGTLHPAVQSTLGLRPRSQGSRPQACGKAHRVIAYSASRSRTMHQLSSRAGSQRPWTCTRSTVGAGRAISACGNNNRLTPRNGPAAPQLFVHSVWNRTWHLIASKRVDKRPCPDGIAFGDSDP